MTEKTLPAVQQQRSVQAAPAHDQINPFSGIDAFEAAQRMGSLLAASTMVPEAYRGNAANCVVAMEFAYRTRSSVFAVMQHAVVIHGKPGWTSTYMIALINQSGKFETDLDWEYEGEGEEMKCRAFAKARMSGKWKYGTWVSIKMAQAEGWYTRSGSKWKNMPDQMLSYRAAAFFGRLHAPEVVFGMQTEDEIRDTYNPQAEAMVIVEDDPAAALKARLEEQGIQEPATEKVVDGELVDTGPEPAESAAPEEKGETIVAETVSEVATEAAPSAEVATEPEKEAEVATEPPAEQQKDPKGRSLFDEPPGEIAGPTISSISEILSKAKTRDEMDVALDLARDLKPSEQKRVRAMYDARLEQIGEL